jgi:hypothetical protein
MIKRAVLGLAMHQAYAFLREQQERRVKYNTAVQTAEASGKPLLVVGGPWGASRWRHLTGVPAHGCGDVCLDMDSHACEGCNYQAGDITDMPFGDKEFGAVFCAHVLEHMPTGRDCAHAWWELNRVSDTVFVCLPGKDTIGGWITSGHKLWVSNLGSGMLKVQERRGNQRFLIGDTPSAGFIAGSGGTKPLPEPIPLT